MAEKLDAGVSMTAADWAILIPAVAGLLSGLGAWFKYRAHVKDPGAHIP